MMATKRRPLPAGLQALRDRYIGDDSAMKDALERARADADVAQMIYDLRTTAGLTQRQLASLVGTAAAVICRLEDADYEGHSLSMLRRIAEALGHRIRVQFIPIKGEKFITGGSKVKVSVHPERDRTRVKRGSGDLAEVEKSGRRRTKTPK